MDTARFAVHVDTDEMGEQELASNLQEWIIHRYLTQTCSSIHTPSQIQRRQAEGPLHACSCKAIEPSLVLSVWCVGSMPARSATRSLPRLCVRTWP